VSSPLTREERLRRLRLWMYRIAIDALMPTLSDVLWDLRTAVQVNSSPPTRAHADAVWWAVTNGGGIDAIRPAKLAAERAQLLDDLAFDVTHSRGTAGGYTAVFSGTLRNVVNDAGLTTALDRFMTSFRPAPAPAASQDGVTPSTAPDPGQAARDTAIENAFPLPVVTAALEREEALLAHLSANASYYWLAMWQALSASQQATLLQTSLPADIADPWPIGMIDHRLAFPINADLPGVRAFIDAIFGSNLPTPRTEDVTLPTTAVTMEARLGSCDGCEEFIRASRTIDVRTRTAAARRDEAIAAQEEREVSRRQARLDSTPPMLDDPRPPQPAPRLDVHVTSHPSPSPAPPTPGG
jgi:hypothetical protein